MVRMNDWSELDRFLRETRVMSAVAMRLLHVYVGQVRAPAGVTLIPMSAQWRAGVPAGWNQRFGGLAIRMRH
jgi:hypothetical protein